MGASGVIRVRTADDLPDRVRVGFVQAPKLDPRGQLFHMVCALSVCTVLKKSFVEWLRNKKFN